MKILHILNNGPTELSDEAVKIQSKDNEIKTIDLSKKDASYESVVDDIFSHDKVISW